MQYLGTPDAVIRQSYDWSETPPSIAVLRALAAIEGVPPRDLHTETGIRLYDTVDLEALDALVTHESDVAVSFHVGEYVVLLEDDQLTVRISDAMSH